MMFDNFNSSDHCPTEQQVGYALLSGDSISLPQRYPESPFAQSWLDIFSDYHEYLQEVHHLLSESLASTKKHERDWSNKVAYGIAGKLSGYSRGWSDICNVLSAGGITDTDLYTEYIDRGNESWRQPVFRADALSPSRP